MFSNLKARSLHTNRWTGKDNGPRLIPPTGQVGGKHSCKIVDEPPQYRACKAGIALGERVPIGLLKYLLNEASSHMIWESELVSTAIKEARRHRILQIRSIDTVL